MSLEQLIDSGQVWRFEQTASTGVNESAARYANDFQLGSGAASSEKAAEDHRLSSGFTILDNALVDGGWPVSGVTEILYPAHGIGELSVLLPALRKLSEGQRWIIWVSPPFQLNSLALAAEGIDIHNHIVLSPDSVRDFWWACEESIKSGACSAMLAWPGRQDKNHYTCIRRLQIAAAQHSVACFLYQQHRDSSDHSNKQAAVQASPSTLRLQLSAAAHGDESNGRDVLMARILKQRGPRTDRPLVLPITRPELFHYSRLSSLKHLLQTSSAQA